MLDTYRYILREDIYRIERGQEIENTDRQN